MLRHLLSDLTPIEPNITSYFRRFLECDRLIRYFIPLILFLGVSVRVGYLIECINQPSFDHLRLDALFHDVWARSIANGNVMGTEVFFRAPLYPYLLGLLYKAMGHSFLYPRIVQHLIGILLIPVVYSLGRKVANVHVGIGAAFLVAVYPVLVFFEGELLFDSLVTFLFVLFILVYLSALDSSSTARWSVAGLILGLLCVTRPPFLIFLPVVLFVIWKSSGTVLLSKSTLSQILGFSLAVLLIIFPVTLRNYAVGNDIVLISSQGGVNFYIGNNPEADGVSSSMPGRYGSSWENLDADMEIQYQHQNSLKPSELSSIWYLKGAEFVLTQPRLSISNFFRKAILFWDYREIPNNRDYADAKNSSTVLSALPIGFWLIGPLGLAGMLIVWRSRRGPHIVLSVLVYFLVTIAFFVCDRYRLPVVPLFCLFTAVTLNWTFEAIRLRKWKNLLMLCLILSIFGLFVRGNILSVDFANPSREELRRAVIDLERGDAKGALSRFDKVNLTNRSLPNLYLNWGIAYLIDGQFEKAEYMFNRELSFFPHSYSALLNLGLTSYIRGDNQRTIAFARSALREKPYLPKGYVLMAKALLASGRIDEARSILEKGELESKGRMYSGGIILAGILTQKGKLLDAENRYTNLIEALKVPPQPMYTPEVEYRIESDWDESIDMLRSKAFYGLGHVWVKRGDLNSAMAYFDKAVRAWPDNGDAWADYGIANHRLRNLLLADSALSEAVRLQPNKANYRVARARLRVEEGRVREAIDDLTLAVAKNPTDSLAYRMLGTLKELQQNRHN